MAQVPVLVRQQELVQVLVQEQVPVTVEQLVLEPEPGQGPGQQLGPGQNQWSKPAA